MTLRVELIPAQTTFDLRRRVLRGGQPEADVAFPQDALPGSFHLGVFAEGCRDRGASPDAVVAVASFSPESTTHRPGRRAVHLRGMAVTFECQGQGVGRLLFAAAVARLRDDGAEVLWCNARDTALDFYRKLGFAVVGDGFIQPETGLPHHVAILDL